MIQKKVLMRNYSKFLIIFPKYHTKFCEEILNVKLGRERIF